MKGYFFSFLITHLINFLLSMRRLCIITGFHIPFATPALSVSAGMLAAWGANALHLPLAFIPMFFLLLNLFGVLRSEDVRWLRQLVCINREKTAAKNAAPG